MAGAAAQGNGKDTVKEVSVLDVTDVGNGMFREVEIKGHMALFTERRIDKGTVPEDMDHYELCRGDDGSPPARPEPGVAADHFGTVLMADRMEASRDGGAPFAYEDLVFTGEELTIEEYLANYGEEPAHIRSGAELARFMDENDMLFHMTEKEADVLLGYLDGHGFVLGEKGGKLFRGDLSYALGKTRWKADSIDDAVDTACEWNYEMIKEAEAQIEEAEDFADHADKKDRLDSLREDELALDAMFDRTRYGKELDMIAESIADGFIRSLGSEGGIDAAIEKMAGQIKAGIGLSPAPAPAAGKSAGRER